MAFVPDPMPAELELGSAVVRLLSEADYTIGRLAGAAGRLVNPYLIGQPLLRREAILSSRTEAFTTPEQLVLLEAGIPSLEDDVHSEFQNAEGISDSPCTGLNHRNDASVQTWLRHDGQFATDRSPFVKLRRNGSAYGESS